MTFVTIKKASYSSRARSPKFATIHKGAESFPCRVCCQMGEPEYCLCYIFLNFGFAALKSPKGLIYSGAILCCLTIH